MELWTGFAFHRLHTPGMRPLHPERSTEKILRGSPIPLLRWPARAPLGLKAVSATRRKFPDELWAKIDAGCHNLQFPIWSERKKQALQLVLNAQPDTGPIKGRFDHSPLQNFTIWLYFELNI